jgi:RHS repeat-associated protein
MSEPKRVVASPSRRRRGQTAVAAAILAVAAVGGAARPASGQVVVEYYHLDALGSIRVVTDQTVQIVERHDFYPYGEECTTGPCATNPGAGVGQPRKFTGKERDHETGLDYFGARYFGSKIGRFTTVDPVYTWQENLVDPQRWNRYAYVRNNPLRFADPDGRETVVLYGHNTSDNPFGHVSIAINGQVFSYGTNYTGGEKGVRDWGREEGAFLATQGPLRQTERLTLDVSDAQEQALKAELTGNNPYAPGAPPYSVVGNSCVSVCERALEKAGILPNQPGPVRIDSAGNELQAGAPSSVTPAGLVGQIRSAGLVKSTQTTGNQQVSVGRAAVNATVDQIKRQSN